MSAAVVATALRLGAREVPLLAGAGALEQLPAALRSIGFDGRLWVVADRVALRHHDRRLRSVLGDAHLLEVDGRERAKSLRAVERIWDWLVERRAERRDALVAFGGGVTCDLAGFAAACYLRGIGLVNVPTTLLAQVDASVGGKTGVNHPGGKNLIGAFHQPLAVVADADLLATLSPRAFANGMAEVAKIAMAADAALFERLEASAEALGPSSPGALGTIVARAIALKAAIVERDERESGERMLLNYGHTVGHALEAASGYEALLHGEAVAVGMQAAARLATCLGMLGESDAERQGNLLRRLGLPTSAAGLAPDAVLARLTADKKRVGATQRWVLAERVGRATIRDDVPDALVRQAIESVLRR